MAPVPTARKRPFAHRTLAAVALAAAMGGCQAPGGPGQGPTILSGDPAVAALIRRADAAPPDAASRLYLDAARRLYDAGEVVAADQVLASVRRDRLTPDELQQFLALTVDIALLVGDTPRAERAAAELQTRITRDGESLAGTRAAVAEGRHADAVRTLIALSRQTRSPGPLQDLIWRYMGDASDTDFETGINSPDPVERGWWRLKTSIMSASSAHGQQVALARWRSEHPDHPAAQTPPAMVAALAEPNWQPGHIALFLPLSGNLAAAGRAVRDGFVAAVLGQGEGENLRVSVFDTTDVSIAALVEEAGAAGVDLIVGPLTKPRATEMAALAPPVPVIVLNYVDDPDLVSAGVWQLGLAIEDEARAIASQLTRRGYHKTAVLAETSDWAFRARRALRDSLFARPNMLLEEHTFTTVQELTEMVGRAMLIEASQARADTLADYLNSEIEFVPRSRSDLDAVVAFVDAVKAPALPPALSFHFAGDLPVFLSQQSISGLSTPQRAALAGAWVAALPWQFEPGGLYAEVGAAVSLTNNPLASLYALGADGYRVAMTFTPLSREPDFRLFGSTGRLIPTPDRNLRRGLSGALIDAQGRLVPAAGPRRLADRPVLSTAPSDRGQAHEPGAR